ncbi:diguanylate cyclase [Aquibacillus halophilus]|uniref:Diguanylate cyclase n=1 Tax=Aquibacillus halophilus TaxID=930132 RepID=A0A6A8DFP8_9BACI|nr:diguanylate cyclase [Aquibacillus halophilus]MRH43356.1 diguanylate cyclase [Aquibacillus halophilus]
MQKYQDMFLKRYKTILDEWKQKEEISTGELYRFLHSIKGTASSIELDNLSEISHQLIERLDKEDDSIWRQEEWGNFVQPLALLLNNHAEVVKTAEQNQLELNTIANQQIILLLDDDIELLNSLKQHLENDYIVLVATQLNRAVQLFYDYHPDLVIIDYDIGSENSSELLDKIYNSVGGSFTPVLFISEEDKLQNRKEAYDLGALDFLVRPIDLDVFQSLIANRLRLKQSLNNQIMIDPLTNAYNRSFLKANWERLLKKFQETSNPYSMALIDLDNFKLVNDQYGHSVGDQVLSQFAELVLNEKRQEDNLIRYGGEEFILIMPNVTQAQAKSLVEGILNTFMQLENKVNDQNIYLSFTAGVAQIEQDSQTMDQLIERSDQALYYGKENGKKCVQVYHNQMNSVNQMKKQVNRLRIAIVDDDRVIQEMLSDQLSRLNFANYSLEVKSFREGETFLESDWYRQPGKYVILLDGIMPRMDGLEVLAKLRKTENESDMGIVMLTGRQKDKDIVRALELGADDYITKPFSIQELEARIKRIVHRLF